MKIFSEGLQFIYYSSIKKNTDAGDEKKLKLASATIPILYYEAAKEPLGIIITFTGFSVNGYKDKRMIAVSRAFQKLGYTVISPQIKKIDQLLIDPNSVLEIQEVISAIAKDEKLNPRRLKPAVFAPSYTAGMCALAIANLPHQIVSSLCLLGTYCSIEKSMKFVLSSTSEVDDYGMHILMKNFLSYAIDKQVDLSVIIQTAIEDNGFKRPIPALPRVMLQANPAATSLYKQLIQDPSLRTNLLLQAWNNMPDASRWKEQLDVASHASKLALPITIIHGKEDNVIASSESVSLYHLLKEKNKHLLLNLTSLLDHGDLKIGWNLMKEVFNLSKSINHFLLYTKSPLA
jgi:hypothetical protein